MGNYSLDVGIGNEFLNTKKKHKGNTDNLLHKNFKTQPC